MAHLRPDPVRQGDDGQGVQAAVPQPVLGRPALRPGDPGRVRAGVDVQAVHRARRAQGRRGLPGLLDATAPRSGRTDWTRITRSTTGPRTTRASCRSPKPSRSRATPSSTSGAASSTTVGGRTRLGAGSEPLQRDLRGFGFGRQPGLDVPSESSGFIPTAAWKEQQSKQDPKNYPVRLAAGRRHPHVDRPGRGADEPDADGDGLLRHRERRPAVRAPPGRTDPDLRRHARPQGRRRTAATSRTRSRSIDHDPGGPPPGGGARERHGLGGVRRVPARADAGDGQDRQPAARVTTVAGQTQGQDTSWFAAIVGPRRATRARDRRHGGAGRSRLDDRGADRALDHRGHVRLGQDRLGSERWRRTDGPRRGARVGGRTPADPAPRSGAARGDDAARRRRACSWCIRPRTSRCGRCELDPGHVRQEAGHRAGAGFRDAARRRRRSTTGSTRCTQGSSTRPRIVVTGAGADPARREPVAARSAGSQFGGFQLTPSEFAKIGADHHARRRAVRARTPSPRWPTCCA